MEDNILKRGDIAENVMAIRVSRSYREGIRNKYVEKSIANLFRKGEANPVRYFCRSE